MAGSAPMHRSWVLVAPGPEDVQGRPALCWNADDQEWSECTSKATEYTATERDAVDLTRFDGRVE